VPIFKVAIYKHTGGILAHESDWQNVYHVQAAGPEDALIMGQTIMNAEMAFHADSQYVTKIVVSDPAKLFFPRTEYHEDVSGERAAVGAVIPQWNVVRVMFHPLSFARPDAKYYRINLGEGDINGQILETGIVTLVQDAVDALLASAAVVVNPAGSQLITATVVDAISMRQLNWHRHSRPGFHRGWVAD